jgi:hypothetical protein
MAQKGGQLVVVVGGQRDNIPLFRACSSVQGKQLGGRSHVEKEGFVVGSIAAWLAGCMLSHISHIGTQTAKRAAERLELFCPFGPKAP